jgi:hypothetical protein
MKTRPLSIIIKNRKIALPMSILLLLLVYIYIAFYIPSPAIKPERVLVRVKNTTNYRLFLFPTQLEIQGQWWSNSSTQTSHILQWWALNGLNILQVTQNLRANVLSLYSTIFREFFSYSASDNGIFNTPGSVKEFDSKYIKHRISNIITEKTTPFFSLLHSYC